MVMLGQHYNSGQDILHNVFRPELYKAKWFDKIVGQIFVKYIFVTYTAKLKFIKTI